MIKIFILLVAIFVPLSSEYYFGNKLWVYWDRPISQAPLIVQLCHQKLRQISIKQKWQLTLLSQKNLHQYIPDYKRFQLIKNNSHLPYRQTTADLIRLTIIQQHGGVWLDITSILIKGLTWLEQLEKNVHLLTNYKWDKSPDMIAFYVSSYQTRTETRNQYGTLTNWIPGYQIWFVSARKKTKAITGWKNTFQTFFQKPFIENWETFKREDIFFRNQDQTDYLTGNKAISYFLMKNQLELDRNLTLFNDRVNINEQMNVWAIHGQYGPMTFAYRTIPDLSVLLTKTLAQVQQKYFEIKFYIKITQDLRIIIEQQIQQQLKFVKNFKSFKQFLLSSPSSQDCVNKKFIVQDSIIGRLINNNSIAQKHGLFTITKQQRDQWRVYCHSKRTFMDTGIMGIGQVIISYAVHAFSGAVAKRQYVQFYQKDLSFITKIGLFINANICPITLAVLSSIVFFCLIPFFGIGIKILSSQLKIQKFKKFTQLNTIKQTKNQNANVYFLIHFFTIIVVFTNCFMSDVFGGIDQQPLVLVLTIWCFLLRRHMSEMFKSEGKTYSLIRYCEFYLFLNPAYYYFLGKAIMQSLQLRHQKVVPDTLFLCFIVPYLLRLGQRLQSQRKLNIILNFILNNQHFIQIIIVLFLFLLSICPNIKFIVYQNHYLIRNFVLLPLAYGIVVLLAIGYQVIIDFNNVINRINHQKAKHKQAIFVHTLINYLFLLFATWNCYKLRYDYIGVIHPVSRIMLQLTIIFIFFQLSIVTSQTNIQSEVLQKWLFLDRNLFIEILCYYFIPFYLLSRNDYHNYKFPNNILIQFPLIWISTIIAMAWKRYKQFLIEQIRIKIHQNSTNHQSYMMNQCKEVNSDDQQSEINIKNHY